MARRNPKPDDEIVAEIRRLLRKGMGKKAICRALRIGERRYDGVMAAAAKAVKAAKPAPKPVQKLKAAKLAEKNMFLDILELKKHVHTVMPPMNLLPKFLVAFESALFILVHDGFKKKARQ